MKPDEMTQAFIDAGLSVYVDDEHKPRIELEHIKIKSLEWINPEKCYATLENGKEVPVYFTQMENQITMHERST